MNDSRRQRFLAFMLGKKQPFGEKSDKDIRKELAVGGIFFVLFLGLTAWDFHDHWHRWVGLALHFVPILYCVWYGFELYCEYRRRRKQHEML